MFITGFNPVYSEASIPKLQKRVTDLTGTITHTQEKELEKTLKDFENRKGSQVAVLIVPSTEEETIEQFSIRVVDEWKLGRKKVDDGVLLLIAKNDRKLRIEVGRGLEGVLTDAMSKRIIAEVITPEFKKGNMFFGIKKGVDAIIKVIDGEELPLPANTTPQAPTNSSSNKKSSYDSWIPFLPLIGFVLLIFFTVLLGVLKTGAVVFLISFIVFLILNKFSLIFQSFYISLAISAGYILLFGFFKWLGSLEGSSSGSSSSSSGSSWSSSSSSSYSSSSSSSSSSYSGGGGSFGGGGASGSW
ncbi:MAG: YgcG family protein [Leptospiraceae bacterium]|nr:YgcG family protein [Leptospiraceae bacterium]NUM40478.1 YgcG family protein [Leptospiraceae bacterium]